MKNLVIMTAACALFAASATVNAAGDAAKGKTKAAMCFACHGVEGISAAPTYPNLAGQKEAYLIKSIKSYKNGTRKDPVMAPMAQTLKDDDIADVAAYFSAQKPKADK